MSVIANSAMGMDEATAKALPIGTPVVFDAQLGRRSERVPLSGRLHSTRKTWVVKTRPETRGIYIGWRTLSEGVTHHYPDESQYCPTGYLAAALVVFNPRCDPVLVPFDALFVESEG